MIFRDDLYRGQLLRTVGHTTYGGADIGECLATANQIRELDRDSWCQHWTALADRTRTAAEASSGASHRESARRAFLRASNYYRNAYVFHLEAPLPRVVSERYRAHRECFRAAHVAAPIEIPFEATPLPGYFVAAEGKAPLVISVGGYDSTSEESYFWNAAAAVARGYHCLTFDGPGQGAMLVERGIGFRPDYDRVLRAVVDYAVARADVSSIYVISVSFGGYLAPRAADDTRINAFVLDPAQLGLYRAIMARTPFGLEPKPWQRRLLAWLLSRRAKHPTQGWALRRGMLVHGASSPWGYVEETKRFDDDSVVERIACPTLVCDAEADDIARQAKPFYERLRCPKAYLRFTAAEGAGEHCESGSRALYHERVFDWLGGLS